MLPFEIVPKGRSQLDADLYRFLRWYMRRNREMIAEITNRAMTRAIDHWLVTGRWWLDSRALADDVLKHAQENFSPERT